MVSTPSVFCQVDPLAIKIIGPIGIGGPIVDLRILKRSLKILAAIKDFEYGYRFTEVNVINTF